MFRLTKNQTLSVATKDQLTYPRQISDGLPIDDMRLEFLSRGDEFDRNLTGVFRMGKQPLVDSKI